MAKVRIKPGVQPAGLVTILAALGNVAQTVTDPDEIWVTAGIDGVHQPNSWHYALRAADVRTKNFPSPQAVEAFIVALTKELGPDYQILWESANSANQHLHIAYRPK